MDNIILGLNQVAVSVSLLVASLLGHTPHATHTQQPAAVEQQTAANVPAYTFSKSISYQGYALSITAAVPKNGGDITGDISGTCAGPITGHYDGDNGAIKGNANITCKIGFFQVPGNGFLLRNGK